MKKRIMILTGYYLPGYKGGGPIQSAKNMVDNLKDYFDFFIITSDRDKDDVEPYKGIEINAWQQVGDAKVYYLALKDRTLQGFERAINSVKVDCIYLNGFFAPNFTQKPLILRKLGRVQKCRYILTPRGDFTGGCENKKLKKYSYIYAVKAIGLYNDLLWHATSEIEEKDIKQKFPKAETFIVANLSAKFETKDPITLKKPGELRLVFVSRIFPKKNIKYALEVLKQVTEGNVVFDIYGPMEDKGYWAECEEVIKQMPPNVKVSYCGEAEHKDIPHIFEQYHAFFFPTLGENYGHVIVEAMMNNCLCILSKGVTPWDDYIEMLDIGAKLSDQGKLINIVNRLLKFDQEQFVKAVSMNNIYIQKKTNSTNDQKLYCELLGGK